MLLAELGVGLGDDEPPQRAAVLARNVLPLTHRLAHLVAKADAAVPRLSREDAGSGVLL
jgi:hypothetical protein